MQFIKQLQARVFNVFNLAMFESVFASFQSCSSLLPGILLSSFVCLYQQLLIS